MMRFKSVPNKKNVIPSLIEQNSPWLPKLRKTAKIILYGGSLFAVAAAMLLAILKCPKAILLSVGFGSLVLTYTVFLLIRIKIEKRTFSGILRRSGETVLLTDGGFRYAYSKKDIWYAVDVRFADIERFSYNSDIRLLTFSGKFRMVVSETEDFREEEEIGDLDELQFFDTYEPPIYPTLCQASKQDDSYS